MSEQATETKDEKSIKKKTVPVNWELLNEQASRWQTLNDTLMLGLRPWLDIQADILRNQEIAASMARMAAQAHEQLAIRNILSEEVQARMLRIEAIQRSIHFPEIPLPNPIVTAMKSADADIERLVDTVKKLKSELKTKDEQIKELEKFIVEGKRKKAEYVR